MRVVIDSNVLLVSISSQSKYHWLFQLILNEKVELLISNEILLEYEEIITQKFSSNVAKNVIAALLFSDNVKKVDIFYNWNLITHDRHFNILKRISFPKVNIITLPKFRKIVQP